jgi:hypothetical protein
MLLPLIFILKQAWRESKTVKLLLVVVVNLILVKDVNLILVKKGK